VAAAEVAAAAAVAAHCVLVSEKSKGTPFETDTAAAAAESLVAASEAGRASHPILAGKGTEKPWPTQDPVPGGELPSSVPPADANDNQETHEEEVVEEEEDVEGDGDEDRGAADAGLQLQQLAAGSGAASTGAAVAALEPVHTLSLDNNTLANALTNVAHSAPTQPYSSPAAATMTSSSPSPVEASSTLAQLNGLMSAATTGPQSAADFATMFATINNINPQTMKGLMANFTSTFDVAPVPTH
jgi:hypothetical protein